MVHVPAAAEAVRGLVAALHKLVRRCLHWAAAPLQLGVVLAECPPAPCEMAQGPVSPGTFTNRSW